MTAGFAAGLAGAPASHALVIAASIASFFIFFVTVCGLLEYWHARYSSRRLPYGHRRCGWCRYSGLAVDVLIHEVEEHRALCRRGATGRTAPR